MLPHNQEIEIYHNPESLCSQKVRGSQLAPGSRHNFQLQEVGHMALPLKAHWKELKDD